MDRWALRSHVRVLAGVAVPLFLATSTQASAQSLRYVTSESGGVYIESPMGAMEVEAEGYSELTLVFDGTSVSAKYDTLYSYVGGTQGDQSPDVAPIVAGSFELVLERPGVLKTVSHPIVAAEGVGGIDPLHMFDDFLIPLPEEPLSVGRQWSEEMMHDGSSFPDATYYQTRSMTMRVERDTEAEVGARQLAIESDRLLEHGDGLGQVAVLAQRVAEVAVGRGVGVLVEPCGPGRGQRGIGRHAGYGIRLRVDVPGDGQRDRDPLRGRHDAPPGASDRHERDLHDFGAGPDLRHAADHELYQHGRARSGQLINFEGQGGPSDTTSA